MRWLLLVLTFTVPILLFLGGFHGGFVIGERMVDGSTVHGPVTAQSTTTMAAGTTPIAPHLAHMEATWTTRRIHSDVSLPIPAVPDM